MAKYTLVSSAKGAGKSTATSSKSNGGSQASQKSTASSSKNGGSQANQKTTTTTTVGNKTYNSDKYTPSSISVGNRTSNSVDFQSNTGNARNATQKAINDYLYNGGSITEGSMADKYLQNLLSGTSYGGGVSLYEDNSTYKTSLEDYIRSMYASQLAQQKAELENNYKANQQKIAVQNELGRQRFLEQANATGLNSGTSGQAELARQSAYQTNMANLDSAYMQAIQQAEANNQTALAEALYKEQVRLQS